MLVLIAAIWQLRVRYQYSAFIIGVMKFCATDTYHAAVEPSIVALRARLAECTGRAERS